MKSFDDLATQIDAGVVEARHLVPVAARGKTTDPIVCPRCLAGEMHPTQDVVLIRGYKVMDDNGKWWSQCLVCAGYYDYKTLEYDNDRGDSSKGWF